MYIHNVCVCVCVSLRLQKLEALLPRTRPPPDDESEDAEDVNLMDFEGTRGSMGNHVESEEEEDHGGPGMGCATS